MNGTPEHSDRDRRNDDALQLLVCSGNLGNACMDEASLFHWIPADGLCREVVVAQPKYPLQWNDAKDTPGSVSARTAGKEIFDAQRSDDEVSFSKGDPFNDDDDDRNQQHQHNQQQQHHQREEYETTPDRRFDIIVFGLQESTFDPPKAEEQLPVVPDLADVEGGSVHQFVSTKLGEPLIGAGGLLVKNTKKTISQFQNITANRDYVNSPKRGSAGSVQSALQRIHSGLRGNSVHSTTSSGGGGGGTTVNGSDGAAGLDDSTDRASLSLAGGAGWQGGTHVLHNLMQLRLPSYGRVVSFQRGEMRLVIWVHQDWLAQVQVVHVSAQNTGRAGLANKGGIVAELLVKGTRLAFLTAHLEAHEGAAKYAQRVSTMAEIFAGTKEKQHDCSLTSHYCFVMGDLNFRTELPNHAELDEEEHKQIVRDMTAREDWKALNEIDELRRAVRNKECLVGFQTPLCNFPPTFKVERQKGYEYIDKRRPSYTDRILWKTGHGLSRNLKALVYEPIDDFASSDHKPIRAAFQVKLNPSFAMRPMLARRRSVMKLSKILNKKRDKDQVVVYKERFHLFVSEIFCSLVSEGKTSPPNPYVCLISDPPEVLRQESKKGWSKVKKDVRRVIRGSKRLETNFVTAKGWPRSSVQKQTFVAHWDEEEIHSEVKTHTFDGIPIDLTGAMLRVTVMDSRQSGVDDVTLGTFPFNLVDLIRSCRSPTQEPSSGFTGSSGDNPARRGSLIDRVFHRHNETAGDAASETQDHDPISTVEIDSPILKNGVETGRIRAKIEAWCMDEKTAKTLGKTSLLASGNNKKILRRKSIRTSNGFDGYTTTEDGRQVALSSRHERPSKMHRTSHKRNSGHRKHT